VEIHAVILARRFAVRLKTAAFDGRPKAEVGNDGDRR
jgi:hypothetical protein